LDQTQRIMTIAHFGLPTAGDVEAGHEAGEAISHFASEYPGDLTVLGSAKVLTTVRRARHNQADWALEERQPELIPPRRPAGCVDIRVPMVPPKLDGGEGLEIAGDVVRTSRGHSSPGSQDVQESLTVEEANIAPNRPSAFITLGKPDPLVTGDITNGHQNNVHPLSRRARNFPNSHRTFSPHRCYL